MSRFVSSYKLGGTKPFRVGCSKLFGDYGGNATNCDKDTLSIFTAGAGKCFVQADQSGADALVVAYLAPPGRYRRLFERGIKPHTYIAMMIFGSQMTAIWPFVEDLDWYLSASIDDLADHPSWPALDKVIKNSKDEYFIGKKTGHSFNYEGGPRTLQMSILKDSGGKLNLSHDAVKRFHATVGAIFPEIKIWQEEVKASIRSGRVLHNLLGYPRRFEQTIVDGYLRDGLSWVPASTVACITRAAVIETQRCIEDQHRDWDIVNDKHDSYLVECPDDESVRLQVKSLMQSHLAREMVGRDGVRFTMRSEAKWGTNWSDQDETNPNGMRSF